MWGCPSLAAMTGLLALLPIPPWVQGVNSQHGDALYKPFDSPTRSKRFRPRFIPNLMFIQDFTVSLGWPKHQAMTTAGWPQEWTNRDAPCSCCEDVHENYVPLCCLPWNFLSSKNHFRRQCTLDVIGKIAFLNRMPHVSLSKEVFRSFWDADFRRIE